MHRMNITEKGQLVIPKELRNKHGIAPNSQVIVTEIAGHIAILPAVDALREGRGMLRFDRPTAQLLEEARSVEVKKDKRRIGQDLLFRKRRNVPKRP
jgi:AbrB family looped-hinge helix DNA binding protein